MRKLKNWLLTAGIAAVMATGVAVGAHLNNSDVLIKAEAGTTVEPYKVIDLTNHSGHAGTTNYGDGSTIEANPNNEKSIGATYVEGANNNFNNSWNYVRFGRVVKNATSIKDSVITTTEAIDKKINKISFENTVHRALKNGKLQKISVYSGTKDTSTITWSTNPVGEYTLAEYVDGREEVTIPNEKAIANGYYKIVLSYTQVATSKQNGLFETNAINFYDLSEGTAQSNLATFKGMIDKDIAYTDENRKQDTTNCYARYDAAKQYFTETLTKEERISFMEGTDYANQVERFRHWAAVRGDEIVKDTTLGYKIVSGQKGLLTNDFFKDNTATIAIIVSVSVLAISGIAIFAITRHKKLAK